MQLRYAVFCLLLSTPALSAGEVVFYRCTDSAGALTVQNMACPKDTRQEKKIMQSVNTVPMGVSSTASAGPAPGSSSQPLSAGPTPGAAAPSTSPESRSDASLLPPPHLFQCTTHDKDTYITESSEPQSRCVALRTVGLDGNPDTGAGQACEVMRDTCARVADADLCAAWKKRLGETEVAWRFARPGNASANQADHVRVQRILDETTCAGERGG